MLCLEFAILHQFPIVFLRPDTLSYTRQTVDRQVARTLRVCFSGGIDASNHDKPRAVVQLRSVRLPWVDPFSILQGNVR
ncbi:hypothetical protein VTO42DRAFT_7439 [Malbranchea cinnamomea]